MSASPRNRPGLSSLSYRVATHARFKEEMLARISTKPALRPLSTRDDDDPAIALLDSWATTLDVLTFYQERIANEGFLRTATERRSVMELSRAIGYRLRPGLAASTWLAFTIEDAPGSPREVEIPRRTRAQSLPVREELPQPFETDEAITARAEWNELRPRTLTRQAVKLGTRELLLQGVATGLQPGDAILMVGLARQFNTGAEQWDFRILTEVEPRPLAGVTRVAWEEGIGSVRHGVLPDAFPKVYALRQRAALFGFNAPDWRAVPQSIRDEYSAGVMSPPMDEWPRFALSVAADHPTIDLDAVYPKILPGSWIVLQRHDYTEVYRVRSHAAAARADFTLTARTSRLTLDTMENLSRFGLRETVVYAQSEELAVAEVPIEEPLSGAAIVLDRKVDGLAPGRRLLLLSDEGAEVVTLDGTLELDGVTRLNLRGPLARSHDRAAAVILGNVAPATQGETQSEALGSGDSSRAFQRFRLSRGPLTYVPSEDGSDPRSTLEVRVSGALWTEVRSLAAAGPRDRVYTLEQDDLGATWVQFGDGRHGARLHTGVENVTAVYRTGLGTAGLIEAGRVTLLTTRPPGVRSVLNPVPSDGGIDAETRDQARASAPAAVLTLGRAVTLSDYEGFARSFTGVTEAEAGWLFEGGQRIVLLNLTLARGAGSGPALARRVAAALDRIRDPFLPLRVTAKETQL